MAQENQKCTMSFVFLVHAARRSQRRAYRDFRAEYLPKLPSPVREAGAGVTRILYQILRGGLKAQMRHMLPGRTPIFRLAGGPRATSAIRVLALGSGFRGGFSCRISSFCPGPTGRDQGKKPRSLAGAGFAIGETRFQTHSLRASVGGSEHPEFASCIARVLWLAALQGGFHSMKGASSQ
jgi:hypothetical protein